MPKKEPVAKKSDPSRFFDPLPHSSIAPSRPTALTMKAARLAGFDGRDGWPDELSTGEFSGLQFPDDGLARSDFLRALRGFEWGEWLGEHGVTVIRDNAPGPGLCRVSGAKLLHDYGVEPSKLLMEWFSSSESPAYQMIRGRQTVDCPVSMAPSEAKNLAKTAELKMYSPAWWVEDVLSECKKRAPSHGLQFDCHNMPGQKKDFFELMQRMDAGFRSMTNIQSLDRYLKGRCKWSLTAKSNPSALPLYEKLFPEAWPNPGAVLKKRKSLSD
jgi:hypothetical protein